MGNIVCIKRIFRIRNISVIFTMMVSGSVLFSLYILTLSCCAGVIDPDLSSNSGRPSRVVLIKDGDEDETRYQRVLDQVADNPGYVHFRRKPLLEEESNPEHIQDIAESRRHRTHGRRHKDVRDLENLEDSAIVVKYDDDDEETLESNAYQEYDMDLNTNQRNKKDRTRKSKGNRTHQKATRKLPQAIIIGVKKGGTRALLEYLRIHPDVRAPGPEPHFFDRNHDKGIEWYRRQMPPTYEGQLTMEKTPSYFVTKGVPGRIYNMSKNTKFIIVVRDPVTRAISDYTQALAKRNDIDSFEEMAFEDNSTGLVDTSWGAIRIGVYAKHLDRWLQYFPLSQMHFVSGERLITDPAGEMEKVQDFLGIERAITEKNFFFNTTKGFPCLFRTPGGSARKPHCLGKTKGREHPKIDPKVLTRLRDFFRPFNQKFYQMVGEDFGWS